MRRSTARQQAWTLLFLIVAASFAGAWGISRSIPLPTDDEFDVIAWEAQHLPAKWLYLTGRFFRGGLSPAEEEERPALSLGSLLPGREDLTQNLQSAGQDLQSIYRGLQELMQKAAFPDDGEEVESPAPTPPPPGGDPVGDPAGGP